MVKNLKHKILTDDEHSHMVKNLKHKILMMNMSFIYNLFDTWTKHIMFT